jgi:hypothetical protein
LTRRAGSPILGICDRSPRGQFRYAKKAGEQKLSGFRISDGFQVPGVTSP